jgi:predicted ATPase/DNA-binding SARP family transcriptional activator
MAQAGPDYVSGVQVHDLGSLSVESDGLPIALNGRRMAAALSILLVNLNEKVRTDVLIESIWGNERSPRAPAALDTLLWRLRRVLDPGRPARVASTLLRTEEQGYRLVIPLEAVDSWQFDATARRISDATAPRQPGAIIDLTESALGLWRGRPYDDVDDDGWLDPRRNRLLEQRLAVQEARVGALLQVGQPEKAVAELVPILAEHLFVERLWGYQILGLYQSGRTAAALEAYAQVRLLLDRELGLRPGPDLQALQERILRHDQSLSGPILRTGTTRGVVRIPRHRTTLVGRDKDVDAVAELLQRHRLVSMTGPVGCGKTRLAAAVARHVQARWPDGVCFVDLSDVRGDAAVADRVQQTLRLEIDATNSAVEAVAELLCDREMLVVLDNCEQVTSAVRALIAAVLERDGRTGVLVTSRRVLGAPDEVVYGVPPLELPASVSPACLSASPAVTLFVERAAGHGISVDLSGPHGVAVAQICQAVDGLPLGIELAAARAQVFQLHEIAASVAAHPMSLGAATEVRRRAGELTLGESIESSHSVLTEQQRIAHRRLSVLPPGFTVEAAVAVCAGQYLPADDVPTALIGLARQSLLEAAKPERPGGPSLFRQLVPIRAHAAQKLTEAGEAAAVREVLLGWISATLADGPRIGQSDGGALDRRLEDNRRTITATLEAAIAAVPSDDVLITLCRLVPYWWLDGKLSPETVRLVSAAAAAVGPGNSDFVAAAVVAAHGSFLALTQQTTRSERSLIDAVQRLRDAPPDLAIFAAELLLAVAAACWTGGEMVAANAAADAVRAYGELLDDDHLRVLAKAVHCAMSLVLDPEAAGARALVVLGECQAVGNVSAQIMCYHALYMAALFSQNGPEGLRWSAEAIRCQQEIGQRNAATTLEARGSLYLLAGNPHDAIRCYGSANLQYSRLGRSWPQIPGTDEFLAAARSQVSAEEFDQAWASGERLAASDLVGAWI